ncbi:hypothetical protein A374_15813 [Fictibacillus macauensis ZFHKF-1]|uniref:Uncharacterized protein n=1 Tax=Fictibacillus macauensis ZFHKF-1 TaxID=1196324 RepID=I8AF58_9BACL|nr:hypothetical protein [Fictibacillus macauensis]EIT84267.1 hypothetical protein A374_15813 [Fictibacillus macauensis ZFHKF-1]
MVVTKKDVKFVAKNYEWMYSIENLLRKFVQEQSEVLFGKEWEKWVQGSFNSHKEAKSFQATTYEEMLDMFRQLPHLRHILPEYLIVQLHRLSPIRQRITAFQMIEEEDAERLKSSYWGVMNRKSFRKRRSLQMS